MADENYLGALKAFEEARLQQIKELEEESKAKTAEQIKQIEQENSEKLAENIEFQNTQLDSTVQRHFVEQLKINADEIIKRSKELYTENGCDRRVDTEKTEELCFTIIYGQLSQTSANKIGMMFPTYTQRQGEMDFLPERIKAVALETILKNKDKLSISKINLVEDTTLSTLCLEFDTLTADKSINESGISIAYDQIGDLDLMLDEEYSQDPALKHAKIKFKMIEGNVINYLVHDNLKIPQIPEEEKEAETKEAKAENYRALEAEGYVLESEAIRYIFDLDKTADNYRSKLDAARKRFREELGSGMFKHEFGNFQMKDVGRNHFYKMEDLKKLKEGKKETIKRGSKTSEILCRYVVLINDEKKLAEFFKFGAYTRDDAIVKYNIARQKLDKNKSLGVIEEFVLDTPDGEKTVYATEELEAIV